MVVPAELVAEGYYVSNVTGDITPCGEDTYYDSPRRLNASDLSECWPCLNGTSTANRTAATSCSE